MLKDIFRLTKKTYVYVRPYMKQNVFSILLTEVSSVLVLLIPLALKFLIDNIIATKRWGLLPGFACAVSGIIIGSQLVDLAGNLIYEKFSETVYTNARHELFSKLLHKKLGFFDRTSDGDLLSRLLQDAVNMHQLLSFLLEQFLTNTVRILFVFIVILKLNVRLAIISIVSVPLFLILDRFIRNKFKAAAKESRKSIAEMNNQYVNSFKNIKLIKNFSYEQAVYEKGEAAAEHARRISYITNRLGRFVTGTMGIVTSLNQLVVLVLGGFEISKGFMSVGGLIAFNVYLTYMYTPFISIADAYVALNRAIVGLDRFFEYDSEADEENLDEGDTLTNTEGTVCLRHVNFCYNEEKQVLKDLCLDIRTKEKLLIQGKSGIGKSTMVSLLKRFYPISDGTIFLDGKDINQINLRILRRSIFYLSQDTMFFEESIRENFQMAAPGISDEAIYAALDKACVLDFVQKLEGGLDCILEKNGSALSGGQKQRLSLAMVFVHEGKFIVFDEPFTGIDYTTREKIWGNLKYYLKDRTVIFIDHYFEAPEYFDRVMILQEGKLVEKNKAAHEI